LHSNLVDVKNSLSFVLANIEKLYDKTKLAVEAKMSVIEDKVMRIQDVIRETVQFSDRTYFMEETRKLRAEKLRIEKERTVYKDKLKIAKRRLAEVEGGAQLITATIDEINDTQIPDETFRQSRMGK
jgi:hypothetical protein